MICHKIKPNQTKLFAWNTNYWGESKVLQCFGIMRHIFPLPNDFTEDVKDYYFLSSPDILHILLAGFAFIDWTTVSKCPCLTVEAVATWAKFLWITCTVIIFTFTFRTTNVFGCFLSVCIHQSPCTGRIWHKVNFEGSFKFKVFLLLDWLFNQG